jgi:starch synthase
VPEALASPQDAQQIGPQAPPSVDGRRPRVLFVTPEMGDFIKAGGLGEVSASLPRQLTRLCDVRVLMPGYRAGAPQGRAHRRRPLHARLVPACPPGRSAG